MAKPDRRPVVSLPVEYEYTRTENGVVSTGRIVLTPIEKTKSGKVVDAPNVSDFEPAIPRKRPERKPPGKPELRLP